MPRRRAAAAAALLLAVALSLGGTLRNGFVGFDDDVYLTGNAMVREGLSLRGIAWAFTTTHTGNWHPLTWLSHQLDATLFGMAPAGHHAVGLLLHAANSLLLFAALEALTGAAAPSWLVAALFALHPLHVESVAWASERKDLLSTLFELLAILAWVRHVRRPSPGPRVAALLLFAAALLAKPMPLTFPFLLLLLDWWPLARWSPGPARGPGGAGRGGPLRFLPPAALWLEKLPLLALAAASGAATWYAQATGGAMQYGETLPLPLRVANALVSYARYLGKALFPRDLAFLYPLAGHAPSAGLAAAALALLAVLSLLALRAVRRSPWVAAGWLWYAGTLLPVIGLVQVGGQAMADRYTYLPLTGPFLALAWSAAAAARRHPRLRVPLALGAAALLSALGARTAVQAAFWRDDVSLTRRALEVDGENWVAHNILANALIRAGRPEEALAHYREAARISGQETYVRGNVAGALVKLGRLDEAIEQYRGILRRSPGLAHVHYNLAVALQAAGKSEEAIAEYRTALLIEPGDAGALSNLGNLLMAAGRTAEATDAYRRAVALSPGFAEARFNLGVALLGGGRAEEAAGHFRAAAGLLPRDLGAHLALGDTLLRIGNAEEAAEAYGRALGIDPSSREAAAGRERALAMRGPGAQPGGGSRRD